MMSPLLRKRQLLPAQITSRSLFGALRWIDKTPLIDQVEPYRLRLFERFFDDRDGAGRPRFNLGVFGRGKKNWKSADLCLAELRAVVEDSPGGSQCYLLANDKDQAADDLALLKKVIDVNPMLHDALKTKKSIIERRDGRGFIEVLPAQDVAGSHGKTYRFAGFDEIHAYRTWDLLEAMQFDPTRPESQQWITSYASLFHKPGVPLYDLMEIGRSGTDPRMLFSWYGGDFTTDPDFAAATPEARANPSSASWGDDAYLTQQQRRLPAHKYRRLHLNLPGLPEGSAYQPEPIMDAIPRGVAVRLAERGISYSAFVDMSGGSNDDAALAIAHVDADGVVVLDRVLNQGPPPPFDPNKAVDRFVGVLKEYRISSVIGDRYAGETFAFGFRNAGVNYTVSELSKSDLYAGAEPLLNAHKIVLLDVSILEQQLLGLTWKGGKIDHAANEHDDWSNACMGVVVHAAQLSTVGPLDMRIMQLNAAAPPPTSASAAAFYGGGSDMARAVFGGGVGDLARKAFGS